MASYTRSFLVLAALAAAFSMSACGGAPDPAAAPAAAGPVSSLESVALAPGTGTPIAAGQTAVVAYTGWLYETPAPDKKGKHFDSSVGGKPFRFKVGGGEVIQGWDQGVVGMKV